MIAPPKRALGKGLSVLFGDNEHIKSEKNNNINELIGAIAEINIDKVVPSPCQPRIQFDTEALEELAASIKELSIVQPITVSKKSDKDIYVVISGEQGLKASKLVGLQTIPAYIYTATDQNMLKMALVENIQRGKLDAIGIALSCQRLVDECSLTQEAMSKRVGKKRSAITNYSQLLKLQSIYASRSYATA